MTDIILDPRIWYEEDTLRRMGLDSDELARARREGRLHCHQQGRVRHYKGEHVLLWMEGREQAQEVA